MLRENADKWNIDTEKIVVQGSSAGGHLAASLGVFWNKPFVAEALGMDSEKFRPNGLMLSYPVITSGEKAHQGSFECVLGEDYADEPVGTGPFIFDSFAPSDHVTLKRFED